MSSTEFGSDTQPPAPLASVIRSSATRFGVPSDLLAGIWRVETNRTYPNPFANGLGYGGEFGTAVTAPFGGAHDIRRIVEPPLQQQADTAARVLRSTLQASGGDIASALYAYSGHGYTQVPGEVTFGSIPVPTNATGSPSGGNLTGGGVSVTPGGGSPNTGFLSDVSGSVKELIWRLAELAGGVILLYLGARSATAGLGAGRRQQPDINVDVFQSPPGTPQVPAVEQEGPGWVEAPGGGFVYTEEAA